MKKIILILTFLMAFYNIATYGSISINIYKTESQTTFAVFQGGEFLNGLTKMFNKEIKTPNNAELV
jgi:hypothetical protein